MIWFLIIFLAAIRSGHSAKILVLCPYKGHSHSVGPLIIADALRDRGHSLTVASFFPKNQPVANYSVVSFKNNDIANQGYFDVPDHEMNLWDIALDFTNEHLEYLPVLKNENLRKLVDESFDLVVMEYFLNDALFELVRQIGAPFILVQTTTPYPWMIDLFNEPQSESFFPHSLSNYDLQTSYSSRLRNFVELHLFLGFYKNVLIPIQQKWAEEYFPDKNGVPALRESGREAALLFVNSHNSLGVSRPVLPSTIEIGGIHILPAKPLEKELDELINNSKGVVFFSLGSVMKGASITESRKETIRKVFADLDETVLWKWESDFPGKPQNVHTSKWFPQRDILAHPKTVLYIGHCGMLGLQEAISEAVPIICIPFFADQFQNAKNVVKSGIGLSIDWLSLEEDAFRTAITTVLRDPLFKANAERVSLAFNDRPMSPKETAIYWSEYVIRHKGAPHIKSPARYMSWIEINNVDVIATIIAALVLFLYLVYKVMLFILGCVLYL